MKLGERLLALAAMIPAGSRIADIGTDHAYLPIYLAKNNLISLAVAGDVNPGPYAAACDAVRQSGVSNMINVRLGNGLQVIAPGEVDVAVIAGMGGGTMIQIMEDNPAVMASLRRLVLQPMVAVPLVRRWLQANHWRIIDETIVEDDGRLYEVIAAEPGQMDYSDLLEVGPVLWAKRHPLLVKIIEQRLQALRQITGQMQNSLSAQTMPKYLEYQMLIEQLEGKLACLQPANQ